MRSTSSKTSPPSCSRTVSPSRRPSRRMSSRSGASFSASAVSRSLEDDRHGRSLQAPPGRRALRHVAAHQTAAQALARYSQVPRRAAARRAGGILQRAFVDDATCASRAPQRLDRGRVAGAVARDLGAPIVGVGLGHARAARAVVAVPEAAVHENRQLAPPVDDVRLARQIGAMQAIAGRDLAQHLAHRELGRGVVRFDRAHRRRAFGGGLGWRLHGRIARSLFRRDPFARALRRQDRLKDVRGEMAHDRSANAVAADMVGVVVAARQPVAVAAAPSAAPPRAATAAASGRSRPRRRGSICRDEPPAGVRRHPATSSKRTSARCRLPPFSSGRVRR